MPIGGSTINWNEGEPGDTESAGLGDDRIRSMKTSVREGLDNEHNWPSSGGANTGYHRYGSARPYIGNQSLVSSSGSDGRLMLTSDTSRFFGVGSAGTSFIGGPTVISAGSYPGSAPPQRSIWVEEFGLGRTISGVTTIIFPNSGYSGVPYVYLTLLTPAFATGAFVWLTDIQAANFTVGSRLTDGVTASSHTFTWRSVGSRTL